jgi:hypothetical protein
MKSMLRLFHSQVVDVDMGCKVPGISNLRALPCPSADIWPQVVFDLDYPGSRSATLL